MSLSYASRAVYCRDYSRDYMRRRRADPEFRQAEKLRRIAREEGREAVSDQLSAAA